jgi:hypothetical protein
MHLTPYKTNSNPLIIIIKKTKQTTPLLFDTPLTANKQRLLVPFNLLLCLLMTSMPNIDNLQMLDSKDFFSSKHPLPANDIFSNFVDE